MINFGLKNEATSNIKIIEVINKLGIRNFNVYMRDDKITTKTGIVNLHPNKGTHWVLYINNYYFDSYGSPPPEKLQEQLPKPIIYSTYFIQREENDNRCASYCLYILYQILVNKISFENSVLKLYYFLD